MRLYEFITESLSTIEVDNDRYEETEELNDKLQRSRWKSVVSSSFKNKFQQLYPNVKLQVSNSQEGISVSTGSGSYLNNPGDEFTAEIMGPGAFISKDGKIYVGLEIMEIEAGQYRGVISVVLAEVTPILARTVKGLPAIIVPTSDESGGAWTHLAKKFGWPYINEVD